MKFSIFPILFFTCLSNLSRAQSLMASYQFEIDAKDQSVNGNHGALMGDAHISSGSLQLDGNGDYMICNHSSTLNPSDEITMFVQFKANIVNGSHYLIHKYEPYKGYALRILDGKIGVSFGKSTSQYYSKTTIQPGSWYSVAVTLKGSNFKIFVNGQLDETNASEYDFDTDRPLLIGQHGESTDYFNGEIDQVRIYDYELSISEILGITPVNYSISRYIKIFPNPCADMLHFNYPKTKMYQVEIYNTYGELVQRSELYPTIRLPELKPGIYHIIILDQGLIVMNTRILKE